MKSANAWALPPWTSPCSARTRSATARLWSSTVSQSSLPTPDTDRAVERSLSGVGSDDWETVEAHNRAVAERVRAEHGEVHGGNAHAFADFMSNHYVKRVETATPEEREEFREEYLPRNAWPTEAQREAVERSLRLVEKVAVE